jgi:glucose/arabinose dehydrogenase
MRHSSKVLASTSLALSLALPRVLAADPTLGSQLVTSGLNNPIAVMGAPGDTRYLYIVERGTGSAASAGSGTADIRVYDTVTHTLQATPFFSFTGVNTTGEEGLLGLAFDPNFSVVGSPGYHKYYVNLSTGTGNGYQNIVSLGANSLTDGGSGALSAANTIMSWSNPYSQIHKGGWIGFSPQVNPASPGTTIRSNDAYNLYILTGDGSTYPKLNDPNNAAQNLTGLQGKVLRIHVDPAVGNSYTIPANNVFAGDNTGKAREIFAYGLRNPFRAAFDRVTGDLYLGDVGQDAREEIDVQKASLPGGGNNYGWRYREGNIATPQPTASETAAGATAIGGPLVGGETAPIIDYGHPGITVTNPDNATGGVITSASVTAPVNPSFASLIGKCVIGGYVYRGDALNSVVPDGTYFFGDLFGDTNSNDHIDGGKLQINSLVYDSSSDAIGSFTDWTSALNTGSSASNQLIKGLVSFGEDTNGELYLVDMAGTTGFQTGGNGKIFQIVVVPEPATLALLGCGVAWMLRRMKTRPVPCGAFTAGRHLW